MDKQHLVSLVETFSCSDLFYTCIYYTKAHKVLFKIFVFNLFFAEISSSTISGLLLCDQQNQPRNYGMSLQDRELSVAVPSDSTMCVAGTHS